MLLADTNFLKRRVPEILLILLWVTVQAIIYFHFGVKQPVDSVGYLNAANGLINGNLPDVHDMYYVGYSAFIAVGFISGGSVKSIALFQILISGASLICLYSQSIPSYRTEKLV